MLDALAEISRQFVHMIGMGCLIWGTLTMIGAMWGQQPPLNYVKGTALLLFGVYLAGVVKTL